MPSQIQHLLTKQFKQFREDRDWSQKQFADYLTLQLGREVSRESVNYWENKKRGVNGELALELATVLKIEVKDLFERPAANG